MSTDRLPRPAAVLRALLAVSLGLPLLGYLTVVAMATVQGTATPQSALIAATNGNSEIGAHTWWSVAQLAVAAALAVAVGFLAADRRVRRGSFLLAGLLAVVSADELMRGHEYLSDVLAGVIDTDRVASWALWVAVGVPVFALAAAGIAGQLRALEPRARRILLVAALLFAGSAAGLELVSSSMVGLPTWIYEIEIALEEAGEAAAVSLVIFALLLQARTGGSSEADRTRPIPRVTPAAASG